MQDLDAEIHDFQRKQRILEKLCNLKLQVLYMEQSFVGNNSWKPSQDFLEKCQKIDEEIQNVSNPNWAGFLKHFPLDF